MMLLIAAALAAPVDPFEEPDELDLYRLEDELVTSASRYAQTVAEAPANVRVISAAEMRRAGHVTLSEVLQALPGIYVTRSAEGRSLAWFRGVTGYDNSRFLLLVDGVPWYDGVYTHAWIDSYLPLSIVKQVEVIKGPSSVLYGTNAFSGAVNVVTWGPADLDGSRIQAHAGSDRTVDATLTVGGELPADDSRALAYVRMHDTVGDGLQSTPSGSANVLADAPVRALNAGLHLEFGALDLRYAHVDYRHGYYAGAKDDLWDLVLTDPDAFGFEYRHDYVSSSYTFVVGQDLEVRPIWVFEEHDDRGLYGWLDEPTYAQDGGLTWRGTLVDTAKHTRRYVTGIETEARLINFHVNVMGAGVEAVNVLEIEDLAYEDFGDEAIVSFAASEPAWLTSVWFNWLHTWTPLSWLQLTGGTRADHHFTVGGPYFSPKLGVLVVPVPELHVKLLYGHAFRAPNARELLVDDVVQDVNGRFLYPRSTADLGVETIDTVELNSSFQAADWSLSGASYFSVLDETIEVSSDNNRYFNRDRPYTVFGTESRLGWKLDNLEVELEHAWTQAQLVSGGEAVYGFPPHMLHGAATHELVEGLFVQTLADWVSAQPRGVEGHADGDPYLLVHLVLSTEGLAGGRLGAWMSCRNLLDEDVVLLMPESWARATDEDGQPAYVDDLDGEGRSYRVGLEVAF